jgi:hypothetical protein
MSRRQAALAESNHAERASRAAALDLIARRRNQQGSRGIVGLEDSDEEERDPTRAKPVVLLDDSEEEEDGENRASNSGGSQGSDPAPAKPLGRLVKRADLDRPAPLRGGDAGDDLAAQLGGLSINRPAAAPASPPRLPAVHVSRLRQVQDSSSSEDDEETASEALTLGDRRQFKLRYSSHMMAPKEQRPVLAACFVQLFCLPKTPQAIPCHSSAASLGGCASAFTTR